MKYFIANWKMNMTEPDVTNWVNQWKELTNQTHNATVILAPSNVHLHLLKDIDVSLAAQNLSFYEKGAHTGEVGAFQLREYVKYSIVGHSERGEDEQTVLKKATQCLEHGIIPIVCFTNPERIESYYAEGIILAWEDPANISHDGIYNAKPIEKVEKEVNSMRQRTPENVKILYGGSVNSENIEELKNIASIDGFLVGNASLDPKHFYNLITA